MLINSKKKFYELARQGLCGNTPRIWYSVDEYLADDSRCELIGVRSLKLLRGKNIAPGEYGDVLDALYFEDFWRGDYVICESPGLDYDGKPGLQGEFTWGKHSGHKAGYHLFYADRLGYMRTALKEYGRTASGLAAINLMRSACGISDFEMIVDLLDRYIDPNTGHYPVIEFGTGYRPFGILDRGTIIWEVRHY